MTCSRGHVDCALLNAAHAILLESDRRNVGMVTVLVDCDDAEHAVVSAIGFGPEEAVEVLRAGAVDLAATLRAMPPARIHELKETLEETLRRGERGAGNKEKPS